MRKSQLRNLTNLITYNDLSDSETSDSEMSITEEDIPDETEENISIQEIDAPDVENHAQVKVNRVAGKKKLWKIFSHKLGKTNALLPNSASI